MKKTLIAATFLLSLAAVPALADDAFDPGNIILANADSSQSPLAGKAPLPVVSEQEVKLWVLNAGYNQVSDLKRDRHALYRGTALLDGETYDIVVDNQGNILGAKE